MKSEKDQFRQMLSDQRSGSVVGEPVWLVISLQRRGKGWGMMNNDFIIHVYDRNDLFFFFDYVYYISK